MPNSTARTFRAATPNGTGGGMRPAVLGRITLRTGVDCMRRRIVIS